MSSLRGTLLSATVVILMIAAASIGSTVAGPQEVDASVRPGDDFYRYANGAWLRSTPLPEGLPKFDTTTALRQENARRVRELIEGAANASAPGIARQVGDYFASQMDTGSIEAKGLAPLSDELTAIAAISDRKTLSAHLGKTLRTDDGTNTQTDALFGVWIHQGFNSADRYVPHLVQGGLGLDRDDYLNSNSETAARRNAYQTHVAAVLKLAGLAQPEASAARIFALESAIAKTHAPRADTDDVFKTNNPWRRADFDQRAPGMDWSAYLGAAGLGQQPDFVVWQPSAVTGTATLVAAQPIEVWKDYLAFHLIEHYAAVLPKAFAAQPAPDRAQQAIAATNAALPDAVGRLYVDRYFPPQAKSAAVAMVENIRSAYRGRISSVTWMSPETKAKALAKLTALKIGLGYPDTWVDYSHLAIVRGDALGNLRRAETFEYQRNLAKLHQPVDPAEWSLVRPHMVGALINFSPNAMQFSAGILQPPYFDFAGDAATNYGSAGAGIGHEISHSFDELGNIYDAQGRLVRWWTADDLARYRTASAPLAAQYDAYCPKPDLCVNGKQVLSENIGDLTGLLIAHDAYILSLNGKSDIVKDGLTGEQRFFLAFARRWRTQYSDAALRRHIATDSHAPAEYRAATVRNMDAWIRAFDIKPGDKLYLKPEQRVRIW